MNKFLYKGVDNAILDIEFKKEQKALEKAQKVENKHGIDGHAAKGGKQPGSPSKKPTAPKKAEGKQTTKNKFGYNPINEETKMKKYPPCLVFNPEKRDIQVMIKKATTLKGVEDIEINPMSNSLNVNQKE